MNLQEIIRTLQGYFRTGGEVSFGYLFGSFAKKRNHPQSDLDIAVYLTGGQQDSVPEYRFSAIIELQDIFKRPVDLIILNEAPPLLKHEIFKTGILFLNKDHAALVEYQVKNYHLYQNQLFLLNRFFEQSKTKIKGALHGQQ